MPDLLAEVEIAIRKVRACTAEAVRRYAQVSGMAPGQDLTEYFIPSFVFDRLGDEYAMTLETNATKLLARDAKARGRSILLDPARAEALTDGIRRLNSRERVDLVLYRDDGSDRGDRPFLALVEFKLWVDWPDDRSKLLRIMGALDTCPFGAMCFIASGVDWLAGYEEKAKRDGDIWFVEEVPGVLHRDLPLTVGAQIVRRPTARV